MVSCTRRDFLFIAAGTAGAIAVGATSFPFIAQLMPDEKTLSNATTDVDLSLITPGMAVTVKWQGKPVLILHRTPKQIAAAKATPISALKDKYARNANLDPKTYAQDSARSGGKNHEEWLILVNICTHLGCITKQGEGKYKGFLCPCHGSVYDTAGRIRSGPADRNLYIPPYKFLEKNILRIG